MRENLIRTNRNELDAVTDGIQVHIERHCWSKMKGWCKAANSEVSGQGLAYLEDGIFHVYEVYFPKQYCSSAYTELDHLSLARLKKKLELTYKKDMNHFRFWWHTHYNFNTFWSGTDDDNAQGLMNSSGEWALSVVINQKGDWLARVDMNRPINITIDKLPIFLVKNSRKVKRKRNFKSDIKRWVNPMSALTKKDDPITAVQMPSHQFASSDWYDRWRNEYGKKEEKKNWWETKKDTTKHDTTIQRGSKYVVYGGKLMTVERKEQLTKSNCQCEHLNDFDKCKCADSCSICIDDLIKSEQEKARKEIMTEKEEKDCPCFEKMNWTNCDCPESCSSCHNSYIGG